jgi:hypothetical protein
MRLLGALLISAALLLTTTPAATGTAPTPAACRQKWGELAQLHGENGNPGGSRSTRQLQQRWDGFYEEAGRLSRAATAADCDGLKAFKVTWDGLERLQYGMHPHDYLFRLRLANGDLRHYRDLHGRNPGRQVMRAFRFLREQAPKAAAYLAPVVAAANAVTTSNRAQVTGYLRDYRATARASKHVVKARTWLQIIDSAELHEE